MAQEFDVPEVPYQQPVEPPRRRNIALIVAIIFVFLLCCCGLAAAIGWWLWVNGDALLYQFGLGLSQLLV